MSKESFKLFARLHPELADSVINNNNITWQKLYELYDIYGENSSVWNQYLNTTSSKVIKDSGINDILKTVKAIDLKSVQSGIENIEKVVGLIQDIGLGKNKNVNSEIYEKRPIYKSFED